MLVLDWGFSPPVNGPRKPLLWLGNIFRPEVSFQICLRNTVKICVLCQNRTTVCSMFGICCPFSVGIRDKCCWWWPDVDSHRCYGRQTRCGVAGRNPGPAQADIVSTDVPETWETKSLRHLLCTVQKYSMNS